jgi:hypothetical protein
LRKRERREKARRTEGDRKVSNRHARGPVLEFLGGLRDANSPGPIPGGSRVSRLEHELVRFGRRILGGKK